MTSQQQTMGFQAEVKQMLHLVVHSLYSNKEIFLRELISNGSDALDKLRFLALSEADLYESDADLYITITCNEKLKTITIKDNGIGLNWEEAVENLGTIAKSGTREFVSHLTGEAAKDSHLIGQFGVGFYASFIVASHVTVKSRRAGLAPEKGIVWQSDGTGEFTIAHETIKARGTEVILQLKKEEEEFLSDWRLRGIINKYSDHICWPIMMKVPKLEEEAGEKDGKAKEAVAPTFEPVNKATALWTLQKADISTEEYQALYKHIAHDAQVPLAWTHNHVEGKQEYISLLYVPTQAPFDLWQQEVKHGLKLYVKRVFIMDDAVQFLPRYLRFVKGIVDVADLPLNISRELLQENKQVDAIRSACTKRVLSMLEKLSQDKEKYQTFWDAFGLALKEGPIEDYANKDAVAKLLRFATLNTGSEKQTVMLTQYVADMKKDQDKIYYITASSHNAAKNSPHLEIFKKKGIDVLLLSDRVDEWLVGYFREFEGKKLQSISKGDIDVAPDTGKAVKAQEESLTPMLKQMKTILGDKVKDVQLTHRLTGSPVCVVADEKDVGLEMQRILRAAGQPVTDAKPVFEINPEHALIKRLHAMTDDATFAEWTRMLFDQALLAEGGTLDNPAEFVQRVNQLLMDVDGR